MRTHFRRPRIRGNCNYRLWSRWWVLSGAVGFALLAPAWAVAGTIYVDGALPSDCIGTYNPNTRSCGTGTAGAYNTVQEAVAVAQAGDTVLLRAGTYKERLIPPRSGTAADPIVFKGYPGETATLANLGDPAIYLLNISHVVIEGLKVTNVLGWGRVENSSNNIIQNNNFSQATAQGTTGGLKFVKSTYNKVLGNTFDDGNDSLVVQESDRNLVQGNTFTTARHSLLSVRCGNFNVIRGNTFHNVDQKAAEIYDCEGVSDAPYKLNATKHNIFEGNAFTYTKAAAQDYRYNGIQYAGQSGIVRRNVFYDNQGGALNFQVYGDEALYNNSHRVYNNTFYNNRCYGMSASSDTTATRYFGNIVTNNIFYKNVDCNGGPVQTSIGNPNAVILQNNAVLTTTPVFVDEAARNLRLGPGSPMIDAGAFLTFAVSAGSGTQMAVADAGYFFDGHGITGEVGDLIQLEGQTQTARVVAINYTTNTLTLSSALTWNKGQKLHLAYTGSKPDMGAYETGTPLGSSPSAPTNLTVSP